MLTNTQSTDILLMYGLAAKSYSDMSSAERQEAAQQAFDRAKEAAFTRNLPIIYAENGYVIAEYADGQKIILEDDKAEIPNYGQA